MSFPNDDPTLRLDHRRRVCCSVVRSQCEGTAPTAVWPLLADVGDQCGLWRGRNYVNEEGRVKGIAYIGPYGVRAALTVILWLRARDVETVLARWDSNNPEVTRLIGPNLRDFASALPLLQVSRRMLHTRRVFDLTLLEKRGIGPSLDGYRGPRHSDRMPRFIVTMSHQGESPAAHDCSRQLSDRSRCIAPDHDDTARIQFLREKKSETDDTEVPLEWHWLPTRLWIVAPKAPGIDPELTSNNGLKGLQRLALWTAVDTSLVSAIRH